MQTFEEIRKEPQRHSRSSIETKSFTIVNEEFWEEMWAISGTNEGEKVSRFVNLFVVDQYLWFAWDCLCGWTKNIVVGVKFGVENALKLYMLQFVSTKKSSWYRKYFIA